MIKQSLTFNDILEKKFKILRTSIMLGNLRNREETFAEYEETAREIDRIKTGIYEELLGAKMYTTVTLEEEITRLKDLISFIENRIKERNDFVDDYIKITSCFLDGLDKISLENELASYKNRYDDIDEYLNNCEEIRQLNIRLNELKEELEDKYENKANNEIINSKLEDELIDEFNRFISGSKYYSDLNYTDIDLELTKIEESLVEKKSVLDTFTSSYNALVNAGISGAEREEYASYVGDAKLSYYEDIEKKCVLKIYELVLDKQLDYEKLYDKRLNIENLLNDRRNMREELDISKRDELEYFENLCEEQFTIIKAQQFNIENIDKLILEISDCESKLEELEKANNRKEIVDLINEFSVDIPEVEKIELPDEQLILEEVEKFVTKKPSNMVIRVKDPIKINVKSVSDTAKLVMKKVVIVLEPKKFNNKRDKLKEAELELEKEKQHIIEDEPKVDDIIQDDNFNNDSDVSDNENELLDNVENSNNDVETFNDDVIINNDNQDLEILDTNNDGNSNSENNSIDNENIFPELFDNNNIFDNENEVIDSANEFPEILNNDEFVNVNSQEINDDNIINDFDSENIFLDDDNEANGGIKVEFVKTDENNLFQDDVISTISDSHDIFLDDDFDEIGIQLDTKEVFDDKSVKEVKELTDIKINANDPANMIIPTEIFIEDPPVEKEVDLFKVTDPFLDDNQFELNDGIPSDEIRAVMPNLGSIGTVKPNNALSKIESVVRENDNIVLPNLGLVDGTKGEVPIVSENYIN